MSEECEEDCEECPHVTEQKPINVRAFIKKFGKHIKLGKEFDKGKLSKELEEFLAFTRVSVDKTFVTARIDLNQASIGMEKAFKLCLGDAQDKKLDPNSFTLGVIFALSRWSFLEAEINKKIEEDKLHRIPYVA